MIIVQVHGRLLSRPACTVEGAPGRAKPGRRGPCLCKCNDAVLRVHLVALTTGEGGARVAKRLLPTVLQDRPGLLLITAGKTLARATKMALVCGQKYVALQIETHCWRI